MTLRKRQQTLPSSPFADGIRIANLDGRTWLAGGDRRFGAILDLDFNRVPKHLVGRARKLVTKRYGRGLWSLIVPNSKSTGIEEHGSVSIDSLENLVEQQDGTLRLIALGDICLRNMEGTKFYHQAKGMVPDTSVAE